MEKRCIWGSATAIYEVSARRAHQDMRAASRSPRTISDPAEMLTPSLCGSVQGFIPGSQNMIEKLGLRTNTKTSAQELAGLERVADAHPKLNAYVDGQDHPRSQQVRRLQHRERLLARALETDRMLIAMMGVGGGPEPPGQSKEESLEAVRPRPVEGEVYDPRHISPENRDGASCHPGVREGEVTELRHQGTLNLLSNPLVEDLDRPEPTEDTFEDDFLVAKWNWIS